MGFEEFAAARLPALMRYAMLLTGEREQARDLVQEVPGHPDAGRRLTP
jgi:DNA-directed RNA polymerase specialized sigma24 family protein